MGLDAARETEEVTTASRQSTGMRWVRSSSDLLARFAETHAEAVGRLGVMCHQLLQPFEGDSLRHVVVTIVQFPQLVMLHLPAVQH